MGGVPALLLVVAAAAAVTFHLAQRLAHAWQDAHLEGVGLVGLMRVGVTIAGRGRGGRGGRKRRLPRCKMKGKG